MNAVAVMPETESVPKVRRPDKLLVRLTPSLLVPLPVHEVFPKVILEVTAAAVLLTVIHPVAQFEIVVEPMLIDPVTLLSVSPCPLLLFEETLVNDPDRAPPLMFKVRPLPFRVTSLTVRVPMFVPLMSEESPVAVVPLSPTVNPRIKLLLPVPSRMLSVRLPVVNTGFAPLVAGSTGEPDGVVRPVIVSMLAVAP